MQNNALVQNLSNNKNQTLQTQETYAAIYIPPEDTQTLSPDAKKVLKNKKVVEAAINNTSLKSTINSKKIEQIAQNLTAQEQIMGASKLAQQYAVPVLGKVLSGEKIKDKELLGFMLNSYAPAFNQTWAQAGYNSFTGMVTAINNGNVNLPNFISSLSNALNNVTKSLETKLDYSKYGEALPIDLVTKVSYKYEKIISEQSDNILSLINTYNKIYQPIIITLEATLKNDISNLWSKNQFFDRLSEIILSKSKITLRLGSDIYENCIITNLEPTLEQLERTSFTLGIKYQHTLPDTETIGNVNQINNPTPNNSKYKDLKEKTKNNIQKIIKKSN